MRTLFTALVLVLFSACNQTATTFSPALPRGVPETEGISSQAILDFVNAATTSKHEFHSFMILRHGKVIAEGWWNPYSPNLKHTLYSTSKSFTSTAAGFVVSENLLSVTDKVISFFPEMLPDTISPFLAQMTVRDLLSMTAGQEPDPTFNVVTRDTNWVKAFFKIPVVHQPGTKFLYNTLATYMVSAIVQKVTGQKVIDYLKPRLFDPLAIDGMDWEIDPQGRNTGGWGLRLKTEDMAKFGQLLLQKGKWNGKQIIPEVWIDEATTFKIDQSPGATQAQRDSSEWLQGYCYQFWRCRHNAFRADGAYGQYIIVMPDQDAVIAITAETSDMQDEINLVWKYLLPAFGDEILAQNKEAAEALKLKLESLALTLPAKSSQTNTELAVSSKNYVFNANEQQFESLSLSFDSSLCRANLKTISGNYNFLFANGSWKTGETNMHGPNLIGKAHASHAGLPPFKIAGTYTWKDDKTIELVLRYIESPHSIRMVCSFDRDKIFVEVLKSNEHSRKNPLLEGIIN